MVTLAYALAILAILALLAAALYGAYRVGYRDGYRQRIEDSPLGVVSDAFNQLARAISRCSVNFGDLAEGDGDDE